MLRKLVIFFTVLIVLITMNSTYHSHVDDHHDDYHAGVQTHKIFTEQSIFHYLEYIEHQENISVINNTLLLLVLLFTSTVLSFLWLSPIKVIEFIPKITFCRYIFINPPPIPIRYVLFHAPPTHNS